MKTSSGRVLRTSRVRSTAHAMAWAFSSADPRAAPEALEAALV
ncbi:hypothetical protein [Streptomyces olivaceiscleroticus]|uniref:Uncharacterized protein n=1 Tax=Streptomyces olivaceiscleroticus TaxID=68245 RepID=A0ABP3K0K7_9ACTN